VNDPAVGTDLDLDLLGVLGVTAGKQRPAAAGTDASLRRQFTDFFVGRQARIIAAFGPGILRLLAPIPPGWRGPVLRVIQVMGAIVQGPGFGASSKEIGLELALFPFELFDFLFQRGDAAQGIAMATLPISHLPAQFEVVASQALDLGAQLGHFLAPFLDQEGQRRGGIIGTTALSQLAVHDQQALPETATKRKRLAPFCQGWRNKSMAGSAKVYE
jgi:hypothetical protein